MSRPGFIILANKEKGHTVEALRILFSEKGPDKHFDIDTYSHHLLKLRVIMTEFLKAAFSQQRVLFSRTEQITMTTEENKMAKEVFKKHSATPIQVAQLLMATIIQCSFELLLHLLYSSGLVQRSSFYL